MGIFGKRVAIEIRDFREQDEVARKFGSVVNRVFVHINNHDGRTIDLLTTPLGDREMGLLNQLVENLNSGDTQGEPRVRVVDSKEMVEGMERLGKPKGEHKIFTEGHGGVEGGGKF